MDFINRIFRGDRVVWMVFLFLCLISIVEVYSASSTLTFRTDYWKPILRHSLFLLTGLGIVLAIHAIPARFFSVLGILLPVAWLFLVGARIFGEKVNGSYRWIEIAGVSFQPSEIAKLCLITFTAFILNKRKNNDNDKSFQWILIASMITCGLILTENGSTAVLLAFIIYLLLFIGQISLKKMLGLTIVAAIGITSFYAFIRYTPKDVLESSIVRKVVPRAVTWQGRLLAKPLDVHNPNFKIISEGEDDNFQESHANIAISNGRIFGKLPGNSVERDFLPQAYSDFIYAIIIEETGLIGGLFVLLLYVILFVRAGIIANRSEKLFPKFMVMGAALILVTQALANMAVAVGLIPVTGQTLPLVSRGGTSILITCIYFGIILSVSRFDNPKGEEREEAIIEQYNEDEETAENNH